MAIFLGILATFAVFFVVVTLHELGHYFAARAAGVKVEEFGLGLPPRMKTLGTDRRGTDWTLNWLPIGGFVRLAGETRVPGVPPAAGTLFSRPIPAQMAVVLAGVAANFLLAWAILCGAFMVGVSPLGVNSRFAQVETALLPTFEQARREGIVSSVTGAVLEPLAGTPADKAGVRAGDLAVSVGGKPVAGPEELLAAVAAVPAGEPVVLGLSRSGSVSEVSVLRDAKGKMGTSVSSRWSMAGFRYKLGLPEASALAAREIFSQLRLAAAALSDAAAKFVSGTPEQRKEAAESVAGPVGMGDFFVAYVRAGAFDAAGFACIVALVSLNLGAFNLLPLPALDGGRFVFLCLAAVGRAFGRDWAGSRAENAANAAGFALFLLFAGAVAYKDVAAILSR